MENEILKWKAEDTSNRPLYVQLSEHIISLIENCPFDTYKKLPSERKIIKALNLGKHTVAATMVYLQEHGYIKRVKRKGTFVVSDNSKCKQSSVQPNWLSILNKGLQNKASNSDIYLGQDFLHLSKRNTYAQSNFAKFLFENLDISVIDLKEISREDSIAHFGISSLRESICEHIKSFGVRAKPEQILVFSSVTQFSAVFANLFLNVGVNFYYEKYSYINQKNVMLHSNANFKQLEMDDDGIVIDTLKKFVRPPKNTFLHIHSCNHNPTGITTSLARRKEIIEYCSKRGTPILEVDSMRGLYYKEKEPPPLKALDNNNSVIFVGNFLHPTSEMLGIAWVCADEALISRISQLKLPLDSHPSLITQVILDSALRSGLLEKYLAMFRKHLESQLYALDEVMKHYLLDIAVWNNSRSSYFLWPEFEKGINTKILYEHRGNLGFNPGYFYNIEDISHISIVTLSMQKDDFPRAIERLRKIIDLNHKH